MDYGDKSVIHSFNLSLSTAKFLAIVGQNGCGKSTFFKALLSEIPFQGKITSPENTIISYLPQQTQISLPIEVKELIVMGRYRFKRFFEQYNELDYQCVEKVAGELQIDHLLSQDFQNLSGGEKQMVLFAQTLLHDGDLFLLDEPLLHLDVKNKAIITDYIQRLIDAQKSVVMITHDIHLLKYMNGQVLNMSDSEYTVHHISENKVEELFEALKK